MNADPVVANEETEAADVVQPEKAPPRYSIKRGSIEPEAQAYQFEVTLLSSELEAQETWFWNEVKDSLPPPANRKGKKKPPATAHECAELHGGRLKFFSPLYHRLLRQQLTINVWPEEPMVFEDTVFNETVEGGERLSTLSCRAFLWPKVTFSGDPWALSVALPSEVTEADVAARVAAEVLKIQQAYQIESEKVPSEIAEGDIAVVTILPKIDGELWKFGVIHNHKLAVVTGKLHPDELREKLIGLMVGNHKLTYTLTEKNGTLAGKVVEADVCVHSVLRVVLPEVDDDLAQKCGKETVEVLLSDITAGVREKLRDDWEKAAGNVVLPKLLEISHIGAIPTCWRLMQARQRYEVLLSQVRGNEKLLLQKLKASSKAEALSRFEDQAIGESMYYMILYGYALHMKIVRDTKDDPSVGGFVRAALLDLIAKVKSHQHSQGLADEAHSADRSLGALT